MAAGGGLVGQAARDPQPARPTRHPPGPADVLRRRRDGGDVRGDHVMSRRPKRSDLDAGFVLAAVQEHSFGTFGIP